MRERVPSPRTFLAEGLCAALALFATDWIAAGVHRTPLPVVLVSLGAFAAGGLAAGVAGALARRRGVAAGVALGAALCVHALALASKELASHHRAVGFGVALAVAAVFGVASALVLRRARDRAGSAAWYLLLAAAVPGASLAAWALPRSFSAALGSPALALLVPALGLASVRAVPGPLLRALACSALAALALPCALFDRDPPRRFVPHVARVEAPAGAPSVVLAIVDTLRADHFDAELAPELSAFARGGVTFRQAVSPASWTLPAASSILTSLHPSQHGAVTPATGLAGDVTTLAEVFQAAGYETAAFTGGAFVSPAFGLDQGFEYFDPLAEFRYRPFRVHVPLVWRVAKNRYVPLHPLVAFANEFGGVPELARRVDSWLDERDPSRPYFLLVHTYQVHDYYIYHPEPDDPLRARGEHSPSFGRRLSVHPSELLRAGQADLDWFHTVYRERIRYVDHELAPLLDGLLARAGGELVVALTADHGEGFDALNRRVHHGQRLHDDLLRVPLVLRAPARAGLRAGSVVEEQVTTLDLMPTLIDLAGLAPPEGLAGRSLLPCLAGAEPYRGLAFGEDQFSGLKSLRTREWKLIAGDQRENYHLTDDPREATQRAEAPEELWRELSSFAQRFPPRPPESAELDPATREHLRDLGYVE